MKVIAIHPGEHLAEESHAVYRLYGVGLWVWGTQPT